MKPPVVDKMEVLDFDEDELQAELERELAALGPITEDEIKAAQGEYDSEMERLPLWDDAAWAENTPVNAQEGESARGEIYLPELYLLVCLSYAAAA